MLLESSFILIAHVFDVSFSSPLEGLCKDLIFPSLKLQYLLRLVTSNIFCPKLLFMWSFFCILSIDIILDYIFFQLTFFFIQDIATLGNSFFFLGSRLGDSLLVQFTSGLGSSVLSPGLKEEVLCWMLSIPLCKLMLTGSMKLFWPIKFYMFSASEIQATGNHLWIML